MKRETSGQILSAVFVDYDNVYLSLKRRSEEAAKRFAKDAGVWLAEIESGRLISPTNKLPNNVQRRIVLNRCYGNPVPRRNQNDNSTDMNSFPFVRHHFLRAGFEVVDCPPLTAQLKNSSDIRMVMDVRDYLHHETYFDEFIILSGDADFTPVLHRLRAHARRTVVFANDFTAAPYVAIADGEIREADLVNVLLSGSGTEAEAPSRSSSGSDLRREIMAEITGAVRSSDTPLPLEVLAERATRALGHDRTVGTNWAGAGSFRDLLLQSLPEGIRLSEQPPYVVYDATRKSGPDEFAPSRTDRPAALLAPRQSRPASAAAAAASVLAKAIEPFGISRRATPQPPPQTNNRTSSPSLTQSFHDAMTEAAQLGSQRNLAPPAAPPTQSPQPSSQGAEGATALQQSIARIHEASQAPPLSPPEYRALFELLAQEINTNGVQGAQTVANVANRARELGLDIRREDVRFALDVVSEADPWFEQGASANLFAGRFRNFVVARCRSHGLNLTSDEIDLIDAWFTGAGSPPAPVRQPAQDPGQGHSQTSNVPPPASAAGPEPRGGRWWNLGERQSSPVPQAGLDHGPSAGQERTPSTALSAGEGDYLGSDEFPRIVRTRLRG